jgi:hypothetical protein
MPLVVMSVCRRIEDMGYESFTKGQQSDWRAIDKYGQVRKTLSKPVAPGKPAPEIEGKDLDGVPFKLSDYRGKVVLLDFWGHW